MHIYANGSLFAYISMYEYIEYFCCIISPGLLICMCECYEVRIYAYGGQCSSSVLNALNGDNGTPCREASARRKQEVCPLHALAELKHSNIALIPAITHLS